MKEYRTVVNLAGGGVEIMHRVTDADANVRYQPMTPPRTFGWYSDAVAALKAEGFRLDVGDRYYREETA